MTLGIILVQIALGVGVYRLVTWVRILTIILTSLSLIFGLVVLLQVAPIGLVVIAINLWVLVAIASPKGKTVFSPAYKAVIAQTPQVKYKTSRPAWILLLVFLIVLVGIILIAFKS